MKHPDKHPESRRRFDTLPEGYSIRLVPGISPGTTRTLTPDAQGALYEIAEAGSWTEWGYGHATSMYTSACERRGYIEVAVPEKPSMGRYLYRATRDGVLLANVWRGQRGERRLKVPNIRPMIEEEERNGVKLTVSRFPDAGTVVQADCSCFGIPNRVHSRDDCPNRLAQIEATRRGDEWPESLTTFELQDAILAEPDTERLRMLNAELQSRLDAGAAVTYAR